MSMKKNTGRNSGRMAMKSWSSNRTPVELMAKRAARKLTPSFSKRETVRPVTKGVP